ncbi:MAG: geranylgeranylglycerol-phosphate geranylgeranyltransferase [Flavobacteriaceae bacterium]|nr:geranylgeranylglycerol-phosphate geranylgeranyltransferase [Flavobacteriaceae bacterium]
MLAFLKLIRWKNLLMIALAQVLVKYALFSADFGVTTTFNEKGFALLVLATLLIAAAGYIINDIFDVDTDSVNRPEKMIIGNGIAEKHAYNFYAALTIAGVGLGFYLSNMIGRPGFAAIFVLISALLYVYASNLKQMPVIGNVTVALIVGISLLIVGVFELLPAMTEQNRSTQITFFRILLDYALFAFGITLVREMVKDIEDIDGDYNAGMKTLPIQIGRERSGKVVFVLSLIPLIGVIFYIVTFLYKQPVAVGYFLLLILAPLILFAVKSFQAETKEQWHWLSNLLKLVMLTGILSLFLYPLILLK